MFLEQKANSPATKFRSIVFQLSKIIQILGGGKLSRRGSVLQELVRTRIVVRRLVFDARHVIVRTSLMPARSVSDSDNG